MSNQFFSNNRSNSRRWSHVQQKSQTRPQKPTNNFTDNFAEFPVNFTVKVDFAQHFQFHFSFQSVATILYKFFRWVYTIPQWIKRVVDLFLIEACRRVFKITTHRFSLISLRIQMKSRRSHHSSHPCQITTTASSKNNRLSNHFLSLAQTLMTGSFSR